MWSSNIFLHQCIDTPMHQNFEGVVKTLIDKVAIWIKGLGLYTRFCDYNGKIMANVKSFRLDWCKLESLLLEKGQPLMEAGLQNLI